MTENAPDMITENYFGQVIEPGTIVAVNVLQGHTTVLRLGVVGSIGKSGKQANVHWVFSKRGVHGQSTWSTGRSNVPVVKLIRPSLEGMDLDLVELVLAKQRELAEDKGW